MKELDTYDFGEPSQVYRKMCKCGKVIAISTQKDKSSDYLTDVFIKCWCGKSVHFVY